MTSGRFVFTVSVIALFFVSVTIAGAGLLLAREFAPGLALALGLAVSIALVRRFSRDSRQPDGAFELPRGMARDLLLLVAVALVFRFTPYFNISGDKDDGLYANIGAYLSKHPSLRHTDPTLETLPRDGRRFLATTRLNNSTHVFATPPPGYSGRYEGGYLPGVYIADAESMTYVFQFPDGHPLWLAIFARILGPTDMGYASIMFGLLSVLVLTLLIHALTRSRGWALVGGLLLAVNPLHAYFSRNTASEITALFFILAALLMFAWAWRFSWSSRWMRIFLSLGTGLFFCFTLTRITGFMFLPFLSVLALEAFCLAPVGRSRRMVAWTYAGIVGAFALSVVYLLATSFPYAADQYGKTFAPFLGPSWPSASVALLAALVLVTGLVMLAVSRNSGPGRAYLRVRTLWGPAASVLALACLAFHVFRVHGLATGSASSAVGYIARYDLAGHGWHSALYSSLVNLGVYLSPFLAVAALWELCRVRDRDPVRALLVVLSLGFLAYAAVLQWVLPYQFYYGRYLLDTVLPFTLLLAVFGFARGSTGRKGAAVLALAGVLWCLGLSVRQVNRPYYRGLGEGLGEIVKNVDHGDLLLWDEDLSDVRPYLTPLIYVYDRNVWTFSGRKGLDKLLARKDLLRNYGDVYVATKLAYHPERMQLLDQVRFTWSQPLRSPLISTRLRRQRLDLRLFRIEASVGKNGELVFHDKGLGEVRDFTGFYSDLTWTEGRFSLDFDLRSADHDTLEVTILGRRPGIRAEVLPGMVLKLNGRDLGPAALVGKTFILPIPAGILRTGINRLEGTVPAFVPADTNPGSRDTRSLGIDIDSIIMH